MEEKKINFNPLDYPIIFTYPERLVNPDAWVEHIPFGMFLICVLKPKILVELGTHSGNSYCAFCQAVKENKLDSKCFSIDTWEGDEHAGYYGPEVLADLKKHHDPLYNQFSNLIQSTFDEALNYFSDGSIDLLHIDGLHTYEAVKHDFEKWLPKISKKGIVLFHDINVRESNFGVWKLWEELKVKYASFEFLHGHGLGMLVVGPEYPKSLELILISSGEKSKIQEFFSHLGHGLGRELQIKNIENLNREAAECDREIQNLHDQNEHLLNELNQTKMEAVQYTLSTSWRITRPLRIIKNFLNRKRYG